MLGAPELPNMPDTLLSPGGFLRSFLTIFRHTGDLGQDSWTGSCIGTAPGSMAYKDTILGIYFL